MKKRLWIIAGTIVMMCIIMLCVYADSDLNKKDPYSGVYFLVNGRDRVDLWEDEERKEIYVFLPAYAELDNTFIVIDDKTNVIVDAFPIESGSDCSSFELDRAYEISVNGMPSRELFFLRSENTASIYMETASGSMAFVHKEKKHKEDVSLTIYTAEGELDYSAVFKDQVRGRGNHSWLVYDKKPYNLYMKEPVNLLGLGEGTKWILLSNTSDYTHIRNKLVMDFARDIGVYEGFSSASTFVNLYANGQYLGLYLLCKSVDDNLDYVLESSGKNGFSIELVPTARIESGKKTIQFNKSRAVEIDNPKMVSQEQRDRIEWWVSSFDQYINSEDASFDGVKKYIDLETWADKSLVDLVFTDYDASYASKFFWGNTDNLLVYAGPCWDYDLSMGFHAMYNSFVDEKNWRYSGEHDGVPWNYGLWRIPEFKEYAVQRYSDKFRIKLQELIDYGIQKEADSIASALELERTRWPALYTSYTNYQDAIDELIDYMDRRVSFLDSYWVNNESYYVITLKDPYGLNLRCYVTPNTVCENLLTPADLAPEENDTVWFYENTSEPFDYKTVIHEDITLVSKAYLNQSNMNEEIFTGIKITILSLIVFLGILLIACCITFQHRRG